MVRTSVFTLIMALAGCCSLPVILAAPFEDVDPQDWKLTAKTGIPDMNTMNHYPTYIAANERLVLRVPPEVMASPTYRLHKKFDSLSGAGFGMQKRYSFSPESDIAYGPTT